MKVFKALLWATIAGVGASALVVGAWAALIYTGSVSTIWPIFGVANQLLATLAFAIGTTVIIKMGKTRYAAITVFPMFFMEVMTLTALCYLVVRFCRLALDMPAEALTYRLDMALVMIMAGLGAIIHRRLGGQVVAAPDRPQLPDFHRAIHGGGGRVAAARVSPARPALST